MKPVDIHTVEIPRHVRRLIESMGPVKSVSDAALVVESLGWRYGHELVSMIDGLHPHKRPTLCLHRGDLHAGIPTVWLLGWSALQHCDIHDHGLSEAAIHVIRGRVQDQAFLLDDLADHRHLSWHGELVRTVTRILRTGSTVEIPASYIHAMGGKARDADHEDVTVHAYWPPLTNMGYFALNDYGRLTFTGEWNDGEDEHEHDGTV